MPVDNILGGGTASTTDNSSSQGGTATPNVSVDPSSMVSPSTATGVGDGSQSSGSQVTAGSQSGGAQSPGFMSQAGNWLTGGGVGGLSKTLAPLLAGGGIINSVIQGNGKIPQKGNLENIAGQLTAAGQPMAAAANTGQLPAGVEAGLDQQLASQIAQIKAKYANMGLSGSSMEQQDIEAAQTQMQATRASQVLQYVQAGTQDLEGAASDYSSLAGVQMAQQKDMSDQIANFLKAFASGGGSSGGSGVPV